MKSRPSHMWFHSRGLLLGLIRFFLILTGITGLLRVIGAFNQKDLIITLGLGDWLPSYLVGTGLVLAILNFGSCLVSRLRPLRAVIPCWVATIGSIAIYWFERLFLWSPDQRGGNVVFMVFYHTIWLCSLVLFTVAERNRTKDNDGSGN